jgi:hypothetical protein
VMESPLRILIAAAVAALLILVVLGFLIFRFVRRRRKPA